MLPEVFVRRHQRRRVSEKTVEVCKHCQFLGASARGDWSDTDAWFHYVESARQAPSGVVLASYTSRIYAEDRVEALEKSGVEAHVEVVFHPYRYEREDIGRIHDFADLKPPPRMYNVVRGAYSVPRTLYGRRREEKHKPPVQIEGIRVRAVGSKPMVLKGEVWHTYVPEDSDDGRVWEWSETTGRVVKTVSD